VLPAPSPPHPCFTRRCYVLPSVDVTLGEALALGEARTVTLQLCNEGLGLG